MKKRIFQQLFFVALLLSICTAAFASSKHAPPDKKAHFNTTLVVLPVAENAIGTITTTKTNEWPPNNNINLVTYVTQTKKEDVTAGRSNFDASNITTDDPAACLSPQPKTTTTAYVEKGLRQGDKTTNMTSFSPQTNPIVSTIPTKAAANNYG